MEVIREFVQEVQVTFETCYLSATRQATSVNRIELQAESPKARVKFSP